MAKSHYNPNVAASNQQKVNKSEQSLICAIFNKEDSNTTLLAGYFTSPKWWRQHGTGLTTVPANTLRTTKLHPSNATAKSTITTAAKRKYDCDYHRSEEKERTTTWLSLLLCVPAVLGLHAMFLITNPTSAGVLWSVFELIIAIMQWWCQTTA